MNTKALVLSLIPSFFMMIGTALADADVDRCQLFVDDFSSRGTGFYGSFREEIVANLGTRTGDEVVGVGGFFRYYEKTGENKWDEAKRETSPVHAEGMRELFVDGTRNADGRYSVAFDLQWGTAGGETGERRLLNFAYFVDLATAQGKVRLWLKNGSQDFTPADFGSDRYNYSESVYLGGYSSARYLWRDSGSPLFNRRNQCL